MGLSLDQFYIVLHVFNNAWFPKHACFATFFNICVNDVFMRCIVFSKHAPRANLVKGWPLLRWFLLLAACTCVPRFACSFETRITVSFNQTTPYFWTNTKNERISPLSSWWYQISIVLRPLELILANPSAINPRVTFRCAGLGPCLIYWGFFEFRILMESNIWVSKNGVQAQSTVVE